MSPHASYTCCRLPQVSSEVAPSAFAQHSQTGYVHLLYKSTCYVDRIQLGIRDLKLENFKNTELKLKIFNIQTSNSKTLTHRPQTRERNHTDLKLENLTHKLKLKNLHTDLKLENFNTQIPQTQKL